MTLVNAGATYTVIPRRLAEKLGIKGLGTFVNVLTAGEPTKLEKAMIVMEIMGIKRSQIVLILNDIDLVIIGVITLESMESKVNSKGQTSFSSKEKA